MEIEVKKSRDDKGRLQHTLFLGDEETRTCEIYHRVVQSGTPTWVQQIDQRGQMCSVPDERVEMLEITLAMHHPHFPVVQDHILPAEECPQWADEIARM